MTLRKRLFWLFAPLLAVALVVAFALSQSLILSRFERQDRALLMAEAQRLHAMLDNELKRNLDLLLSYAKWDDSYEFMLGLNEGFIRRNMDVESLRQLNFDFVVFLDQNGQIHAEQWLPPDLPDLLTVGDTRPQSLEALRLETLATARRLQASSNPDGEGQLLLIQGVPLFLAMASINNNQNSQRDAGTLVAGHLIDGERLEKLQNQVSGALNLLPPTLATEDWQILPNSNRGSLPAMRISERRVLDSQRQQLDLLFSDTQDTPQLLMELTSKRTLYNQGRRAIGLFLLEATAVGLVALLLIYLGLNRWVLRRVSRMQGEVAQIGPNSSSLRLSDAGTDELGILAGDINRMLERLEQSETRDRQILAAIQDGYFELSSQGEILTLNPALCRMLGYSEAELLHQSFEKLLLQDDIPRARERLAKAYAGDVDGDDRFAAPLERRDGSWGHYEARLSLIRNSHGQFIGYRGILRDITEQMVYQNQLLDMAYRDPLTGLGNRKAFAERLRLLLDQSRQQHSSLALLFMDLDRFKQVNDSFGHDIGDALLQSIAERLRGAMRQPDRVYRLGGDEFTLILPETDREVALKLAERLLAALRPSTRIGELTIDFVTPSIGIALFPEHADNQEALIKAADSAMYQAKQQRDCACLYQPEALSSPSQTR
ncbi:MAG: diguanylate cyclase domain-containing protein [Pseudomonas sp.]